MAELAKKLHFLKNGTEQTAKAYSTTDEVGSIYIPSKIDGVACYIPVGSVSDAMATNGRVIKSGTTYAIKSQSKPAYAEKSWTTPGTYTWTAPAGVTRVRVAVCGGGGGAVEKYKTKGTYSGTNGNSSSFGNLLTAGGGGKGSYTHISRDEVYHYGGTGGSPNGRNGGIPHNGAIDNRAIGFALSFSLSNGNYGYGGWIQNTTSDSFDTSGCGGGSGGYNTGYVTVASGTTYTIIVGSGGATNQNGQTSPRKYYNGNSGFVYIAYGGDI